MAVGNYAKFLAILASIVIVQTNSDNQSLHSVHYTGFAWAEILHDALYRTVLAGGIAPFEDHRIFCSHLIRIRCNFTSSTTGTAVPCIRAWHLLQLAHRSLSRLPSLSSNRLPCARPINFLWRLPPHSSCFSNIRLAQSSMKTQTRQ